MSKTYAFTLLAIVAANFLVPLYFLMRNPRLSRTEKKRTFLRLLAGMGAFTALSLAWIYYRFKNP